jgi:exosortase D (VPLPA-CTERM-specific)
MAVDGRHAVRGMAREAEGLLPGGLWLALAGLAAALAFADGIAALLEGWRTPEYSHGPLIPLISGYLFLRQLRDTPPAAAPPADRGPGIAVILGALALGALGTLTGIDDLVAGALILWVWGMVLACLGWRRGRAFWPPVLHLVFMLPLPDVLYYQVSIALQGISSELGVRLIRMAGVPVFLDGHIIDLHVTRLHVAEACSGLRYLFPVMSFTYVFAVLYRGPLWLKAALLGAAVPIAVAANAGRIGAVGVLVEHAGLGPAEGFMHLFEGWAVFGLCILLMLLLAWGLKRLTGERRPLLEVLDVDTRGLGATLARAGAIRPAPWLVGSALALALAGGAAHLAPALQPERPEIARDPFALFPRALGEWRLVRLGELDAATAAVLGADDHLLAELEAPGMGAPVELFAAWYADQGRGGIHSPEVCIPAGGWEMSAIGTAEVATPAGPVPVNRAVIAKGLERRLVYYWMEQRGRRLTSELAARAALLLDRVRTGRTDGALIRLVTALRPGETEAEAAARLDRAVADLVPALGRFVPGAAPGGS